MIIFLLNYNAKKLVGFFGFSGLDSGLDFGFFRFSYVDNLENPKKHEIQTHI